MPTQVSDANSAAMARAGAPVHTVTDIFLDGQANVPPFVVRRHEQHAPARHAAVGFERTLDLLRNRPWPVDIDPQAFDSAELSGSAEFGHAPASAPEGSGSAESAGSREAGVSAGTRPSRPPPPDADAALIRAPRATRDVAPPCTRTLRLPSAGNPQSTRTYVVPCDPHEFHARPAPRRPPPLSAAPFVPARVATTERVRGDGLLCLLPYDGGARLGYSGVFGPHKTEYVWRACKDEQWCTLL